MFKICIVGSRTNASGKLIFFYALFFERYLTCIPLDCAAILYGPIINGQEFRNYTNVLFGNEKSPVVMTCQVECLNLTYTHNPAIALVSLEITHNFYKDIRTRKTYDMRDGLYQKIDHSPPRRCDHTHDIMEYSFDIYPTIKMNHTMVRCGVTYISGPCWGEQVVLVQYVNDSPNTGE